VQQYLVDQRVRAHAEALGVALDDVINVLIYADCACFTWILSGHNELITYEYIVLISLIGSTRKRILD
jgi:hypothetical protein